MRLASYFARTSSDWDLGTGIAARRPQSVLTYRNKILARIDVLILLGAVLLLI